MLRDGEPAVVALGGGAVLSERTRSELAGRAFTVLLDVDPETAWLRVGGRRPAARAGRGRLPRAPPRPPAALRGTSPTRGRATSTGSSSRRPACTSSSGRSTTSEELVPGEGPVELVADTHVAGIHGIRAQVALGARDVEQHEVPAGEAAKTPAVLERLWASLRIGRDGALVALGGGSTTDVVGARGRDVHARRRHGRPCRRRSSDRSTPGSAGRPPSTCPARRTSSAPSTGPPASSATRRSSPRCRTTSGATGSRRWSRPGSSPAGRCGSSRSRTRSAPAPRSRRASACGSVRPGPRATS